MSQGHLIPLLNLLKPAKQVIISNIISFSLNTAFHLSPCAAWPVNPGQHLSCSPPGWEQRLYMLSLQLSSAALQCGFNPLLKAAILHSDPTRSTSGHHLLLLILLSSPGKQSFIPYILLLTHPAVLQTLT